MNDENAGKGLLAEPLQPGKRTISQPDEVKAEIDTLKEGETRQPNE